MKPYLIVISLLLLSACGVKGRLYHPEDPPTRKPLFSSEATATDSKKSPDDDQAAPASPAAPDTNVPGKDKDMDIENTGIGNNGGVNIEPGNK